MICKFKECWLSGEEQEPHECEWCFVNEQGEEDCGYG